MTARTSPPSAGATLAARGVTVRFGTRTVLDDETLTADAGEVVALVGPSGSGKSTLLHVIAGTLAADTGRVLIDDRDVTDIATHRRRVGMVFQDEQLFPHLDVGGNVAFGLRMAGMPRAARQRLADELLDTVGLAGFAGRRVAKLSGGERKRVALARALAPEPRVLLLDEPLTGLDAELHDRLASEVATILRGANTTAVWVTHDLDEARSVADRIHRLGGHNADVGRP